MPSAVPDILDRIVAARRADLERLGPDFGAAAAGTPLPAARTRPLVPFLREVGAILEIKRASPSKGDIAPGLDAAATAAAYDAAGARNVSVLTEGRWFKGSLADLLVASTARPDLSFLRKDFILREDELDVSYRAGADAVLLIARIHEGPALAHLAARCRDLGMTPFVEVREEEDYAKLEALRAEGPVLAGVNARDLSTFSVDPLVPAAAVGRLGSGAVYESGIRGPGAAAYARSLGFRGILVGESAARDPAAAAAIVAAFSAPPAGAGGTDASGPSPNGAGRFWRAVAERRERLRREAGGARPRPLVKICGLTRLPDALYAAELGADLLGFVFAPSPRAADAVTVREVAEELRSRNSGAPRPLLVGVVVDPDSEPGRGALALAADGILDAIQYHGEGGPGALAALDGILAGSAAGRYGVARIGSPDDLPLVDALKEAGEPRVLVDARSLSAQGGTGSTIPDYLTRSLCASGGLWLAGGLGPDNLAAILRSYAPELVDASSRLEAEKGRKDRFLMERFFKELHNDA